MNNIMTTTTIPKTNINKKLRTLTIRQQYQYQYQYFINIKYLFTIVLLIHIDFTITKKSYTNFQFCFIDAFTIHHSSATPAAANLIRQLRQYQYIEERKIVVLSSTLPTSIHENVYKKYPQNRKHYSKQYRCQYRYKYRYSTTTTTTSSCNDDNEETNDNKYTTCNDTLLNGNDIDNDTEMDTISDIDTNTDTYTDTDTHTDIVTDTDANTDTNTDKSKLDTISIDIDGSYHYNDNDTTSDIERDNDTASDNDSENENYFSKRDNDIDNVTTTQRNSDTDTSTSTNTNNWVVGNVTNDFNTLQVAIDAANMDSNTIRYEHINKLHYIAKYNRRTLYNDIQKFTFQPLLLSFFVLLLQQLYVTVSPLSNENYYYINNYQLQSNGVSSLTLMTIGRSFLYSMNRLLVVSSFVQFWLFSVAVPVIFYLSLVLQQKQQQRIQQRQQEQLTLHIPNATVTPTDISVSILSMNNKNSTVYVIQLITVYVIQLMEQWMSSIIGTISVSILYAIRQIVQYYNTAHVSIDSTAAAKGITSILTFIISMSAKPIPCILITQIIVRLGILSSIQQYPHLLYYLSSSSSSSSLSSSSPSFLQKQQQQEKEAEPIQQSIRFVQSTLFPLLYHTFHWMIAIDIGTLISTTCRSYNPISFLYVSFITMTGLALWIIDNNRQPIVQNSTTVSSSLLPPNFNQSQYDAFRKFSSILNAKKRMTLLVLFGLIVARVILKPTGSSSNLSIVSSFLEKYISTGWEGIKSFVYTIRFVPIQSSFIHYYTLFKFQYVQLFVRCLLLGTVIMNPIRHIVSLFRKIRIMYSHGLSLGVGRDINIDDGGTEFITQYKQLVAKEQSKLNVILATPTTPVSKSVAKQFRTIVATIIKLMFGSERAPLLSSSDSVATMNNTSSKTELDFCWRYQIQWYDNSFSSIDNIDEPIAGGDIFGINFIGQLVSNFWYWFLFKGSVDDKLQNYNKQQRKQNSDIKQRRLVIWQRIQDEVQNSPPLLASNSLIQDRTKWKSNAMSKLAQQHQQDYEQGTISDPLGIAIQQTFGIGLGYNFDHMSKLLNDNVPSTRRLQARAAKSALRRAQQLFDTERTKEILNNCSTVHDRDVTATLLRDNVKNKLKYLADRLTELVPVDRSLSNPYNDENNLYRYDTKIEQFNSYGNYERTADNEYTVQSRNGSGIPPRSTTVSPSIRNLIRFGRSIVKNTTDKDEQYYSSALANVTSCIDIDANENDIQESVSGVSQPTRDNTLSGQSSTTLKLLSTGKEMNDSDSEQRLIEDSIENQRKWLLPVEDDEVSQDFFIT